MKDSPMMTTVTPAERYTKVAVSLHWLIALIVIGNLIGGLTIDVFLDNADPAMVAWGRTIMGIHKAMGLLVIALTLVRIGWRLANPPPPPPAHMTPLERRLAGLVHLAFYILLLALPLTGWALVSTGKVPGPVSIFGVFGVPPLPLPASMHGTAGEGHELLGWVMVATLVLHVLAAVKHQWFDRDNLLARMRFGTRRA
jgi:cytochrome b561